MTAKTAKAEKKSEELTLHTLKGKPGARRKKRRIGQGDGSGMGRTGGRGQKGQGARSGGKKGPQFEGGQVPLYMRIPKRGFNNKRYRTEYQVVNLDDLARVFKNQTEVTLENLRVHGLVKGRLPVKVLGNGELKKPLKVQAHAFTKSAAEKIEKAGGSAEVFEAKKKAAA